jgi:hypothetical protein
MKMWNSIPAGIPQKQDDSEVPKMSRALAQDVPVVDHQGPTKDTPSVAVADTDNVAAGSVKRQDRAAVRRAITWFILKMYKQQMKLFKALPITPYMTTAEMLDKLFDTADKS